MINAIIFDLWNTLARKPRSISGTLKKKFKLEFSTKQYEQTVQLRKWNSLDELAQTFLNRFGIKTSNENINYVANTFLKVGSKAKLYLGAKELLRQLSKNYKIGILSNTTNYEIIQKKWGIETVVDQIVYSYETGKLKPDKESFEIICDALDEDAPDCLFIDDTYINTYFARKNGLKSIQYTSMLKLVQKLKEFEIQF